jgi:hypothetical protein
MRTELDLHPVVFQASNEIAGTDFDDVNGMMFENNGSSIFYIHNQSGGSVTITVHSVPDEAGRVGDYEKTIEDDTIHRFGVFRPQWWNQQDDDFFNYVFIDSTVGTGVKIYGVDLTRTVREDDAE